MIPTKYTQHIYNMTCKRKWGPKMSFQFPVGLLDNQIQKWVRQLNWQEVEPDNVLALSCYPGLKEDVSMGKTMGFPASQKDEQNDTLLSN